MTRKGLLVGSLVLLLCSGLGPAGVAKREAPDAGWLAKAQQQIAEREYHASENGEGLQAPNRAHNLRTYFETTGIRVHDRTAGGSPELLRLSLSGVGRGDRVVPAEAGADVVAHDNRVEIAHAGLLEWYVNSPEGLEQGFTLDERPAADGALVLELAVAGAQPARRRGRVRDRSSASSHTRSSPRPTRRAARSRRTSSCPMRGGCGSSSMMRARVTRS